MKIRTKLLALLLLASLAPMVAVTTIQRRSMHRLAATLAEDIEARVTQDARRQLGSVVRDYVDLLSRVRGGIELAVRVQALQVERLLSYPPPAEAVGMIDARRIDPETGYAPGMELSATHRRSYKGSIVPMFVDRRKQMYFLPRGVRSEQVGDVLRRLSGMMQVYRRLGQNQRDMIYWQYTAMASGLHTSYPAHFIPPDYDPRVRAWYKQAMAAGDLVWTRLVDASTLMMTITASMPVRDAAGTCVGVTAIDLPISQILEALALQTAWAGDVKIHMVLTDPAEHISPEGAPVIVNVSAEALGKSHWRKKLKLPPVRSDDPATLERVLDDLRAGKSGMAAMPLDGRQMLWAYGVAEDGPALMALVPKDSILAPARRARDNVLAETNAELLRTSVALLVVLVLAVGLSLWRSRAVTEPVRRLARAAEQIARGDLETRIHVGTRDELGDLAERFNEMTAGLKERQQLKTSLAVAMEIQQHLLPQKEPRLPGFEVVGHSHYCDETGGDYYDFIDLTSLGADRVGIALGDISGHGVGAALLMASARAVLRSHAPDHSGDLAALFDDINVHLVRDTGEGYFMTLFYGVLDARQRSLMWASGGHDPAMWVHRSSGRIEELPNTGIPLGIIEETSYEGRGPVHMESGDVILIGTDGIWEAADSGGRMFGKQRLRDVLAANASRHATEIRTAIAEAVTSFRGPAPQKDDVTLVVIKAL